MNNNQLSVIGHSEKIDLPTLEQYKIPAKIDTGADSSSIWASKVVERSGKLTVVFFGKGSKFYTGEEVKFSKGYFKRVIITNSFGHQEIRYKIMLSITVKERNIKATFTLANRENMAYPILLGKRLLKGKFLVDVNKS